ncbi:NlpC/P60 family protein [Streptomyces sp. NPDC006872]|uniref:C40 family peptidase n=1 Tax=Streptomyces sp. NPDC006872 TaxID=3155720 RepID=UPI00340A01F2
MATDRSPRSPGNSTDEPSRAEIQQRVSSLYDRAETDTGTYNATRAASTRSRRGGGSGGRRTDDQSLEAVAKQWFDSARSKVGPITPAVLPADRQPARPARPARPASAPERSADSPVVRELEAATRRGPELTGRAVAALPAVPEQRRDEPKALAPAALALPAAPASPASPASPAAAPANRQASLKNTKEQIGRKLATAREVLARAIAQPVQPQAMQSQAMQSQPMQPQAMQSQPMPPEPMQSQVMQPQTMQPQAMQSQAMQPQAASAMPTAVLPVVEAQPAEPQQVQQPWDTAEQQAFRAEITAAWAGRPTAAASGAAAPGDTGSFLTTGELGFATPASGFATPEVAAPAPSAPDYRASELGFGTPPFGLPIPELGLAAPGTAFPAPGAGPATSGYQPSELDGFTPPSGFAVPEQLPLMTPESGFAAAPTGYASGYQTSELGVMAPASDLLTNGTGFQAAPAGFPAEPVLPAAVPQAVPQAAAPQTTAPPAAFPTDVTSSTTGTAYLGKADKALAFARAQIGRPCVWGATGPESYDCSSLTQAAWKTAGVTLPRAAIDQARDFTRISLADLRPGDLVFFFDDLSHTGLCTGNGMMIHAPGPGSYIREEAILPFGEGALRGAVRPL